MSAAHRAPRVHREAGTITLPPAPMAHPREHTDALRLFDSVPIEAGYGIAAADRSAAGVVQPGEVVVYDERGVSHQPLVDGALYVVEYQSPAHSLPAAMFAQLMLEPGPPPRMKINRCIRRLARSERDPTRWYLRPLKADGGALGGIQIHVLSDGPYGDRTIRHNLIGRVVGLYNPTALRGAA